MTSNHPAQWLALLGAPLARGGQRPLFTFLEDGERPSDTLTLGALERRARQIAVQLAETCAPGDRALLLYPAGLDFVTALFGHPSPAALARHLSAAAPAASAPRRGDGNDAPIAVVGLACRFPGAADLAAFWRLLEEGRGALAEGPRCVWPWAHP